MINSETYLLSDFVDFPFLYILNIVLPSKYCATFSFYSCGARLFCSRFIFQIFNQFLLLFKFCLLLLEFGVFLIKKILLLVDLLVFCVELNLILISQFFRYILTLFFELISLSLEANAKWGWPALCFFIIFVFYFQSVGMSHRGSEYTSFSFDFCCKGKGFRGVVFLPYRSQVECFLGST